MYVRSKPNILWITIDAARKDRFSGYGYKEKTTPFIDKLAEKSIVFENAFANAPWTLPSVGSMFTGLYPSEHGAINEKTKLRKQAKTIAEVLKEKGYSTLMITQNDGWVNSFFRLTKGFDKVYDIDDMIRSAVGVSIRGFGKYVIGYDELTRFVFKKELKKQTKPWFIYIHLMDTHLPYEPESNLLYSLVRYLVFYKGWKRKIWNSWVGKETFSEREEKILNELYEKALKNVDSQIEKLESSLDDFENTIVVVTSDHGENIGDFGLFDHQFSVHDTLIRVPLIIYVPSMNAKKVTSLFETKDLFFMIPNLADGKFDSFSRDYIYGENSEPLSLYSKLVKENKNLVRNTKYIATTKVKYIQYDDGADELRKEDKTINQKDALEQFRELCKEKQKKLNKSKAIYSGL